MNTRYLRHPRPSRLCSTPGHAGRVPAADLRSSQRKLIALAVAAACFPASVFAAPKGAQFTSGSGSVTQTGSQTLIQAGNKSIIQYSSFDIGRGESVRFIQPGKNSTVLNRVLSDDPTRIFGQLRANGTVYIVNPFGIYFQNGSMINVGGLYAGAGKLSDDDFLSSKNYFSNLSGPVANRGTIRSASNVTLAGSEVANSGYIKAPAGTVVMSSGENVLIGERGGSVFVQANEKAAPSTKPKLASGDLFSMAVVNSGVIKGKNITVNGGAGSVKIGGTLSARSAQASGGKIEITGKNVALRNARLDASGKTGGGTVLIGGDYQGGGTTPHAVKVAINPGSTISADALAAGDGGKVIVWSDKATAFSGKIAARGGSESGNGGFVEVSSKNWLGFYGKVSTLASKGVTGTLLLDPADITISTAPNLDITAASPFADATDNGGVSNLNVTTLTTALASNDVIVTTSTAAGVAPNGGRITVISPVTWASTSSLTLTADSSIIVNAAITNTNATPAAGGITLNAATGITLNAALSTLGTVTLNHGAALTQTAGVVSAGTLNLTGAGVGTNLNPLAISAATLVLNETAGVFLNETDAISLSGTSTANLNLTAGGAITQNAALTVGGAADFDAGAANDITLGNTGNNFNSVTATGQNLVLTDANALILGNITATSLTAHSGASGAGDLTFTSGAILQADTQSYQAGDGAGAGAVAVVEVTPALPALPPSFRNTAGTAAPASFTLRQDAAIADGDLALAAQFGVGLPAAYTLQSDNGSIEISSVVSAAGVAGTNLTLVASTNINLATDLTLDSLAATSPGTITLGANITAAGGTVSLTHNGALTRTGGLITADTLNLGGSGNVAAEGSRLTTTVTSIVLNKTAGNTFLAETNAVQISGATGGDLTLASGAITQTGSLAVTGASSFAAGANSITLDNAANDFTGAVTLANSGANNVAIRDVNALSIGGMTLGSGTLAINATGISQTGAITQALLGGAVTITGNTGAVILANAGNDFTGAVTVTNSGANNVSLRDANTLVIGGLTLGSGTLALNAVGISQTGAITQAASGGAVTITGNAGAVILANAGNDFTGAVTVTNSGANNVSLRDASALAIGGLTLGSGTLTLNAIGLSQTGAITQAAAAGAVTITGNAGAVILANAGNDFTGGVTLTNSGANNVSLRDANALQIAGLTVGSGTLSINAVDISQSGAITQAAGGGAVTITGNAGSVLLANAGNDFTGAATLTNSGANAVSLRDANDLLIAGMSVGSGTLTITADGDGISQTGAIIQAAAAGAVTLAGNAGDIILTNTGNDFTGVVSITNNLGNAVNLVDTNALTLGDVTTSALTAQSGASGTGDLGFAPASTIQSDFQSYQAGDGPGGAGTAAIVDALTNAPTFRNTAGTLAPGDFSVRQDGAIVDANLAALAQFGGTAPLNYTLQSDDASVTIATGSKVNGSNLTLQAATEINVNDALSLASFVATGTTINLNAATLLTIGLQTYNGAVKLVQDVALTSSGGGAISFTSTIDTSAGAASFRALTVNTAGVTAFGNGGADHVGALRALASLTTDAPGSSVFNIVGGTQSVLTTGIQTYNDRVTLAQDTVLTSTGAGALGDIRFNATLDTEAAASTLRSLTVNTAGTTGFGDGGADNVGLTRALASLTTDAAGATTFNILGGAQSVLTNGSQTYGDAVTLVQNTILASNGSGDIAFHSTVDTAAAATALRDLAVTTTGATLFGNGGADFVGAASALASLTTNVGGSTIFNILGGAPSVLTSGAQTYHDAVRLVQNTILTSTIGGITFNTTLDSQTSGAERSLTVNSPVATTFAGAVGGSVALASLSTDAAGTSSSSGVTTTGATSFNDDTTLGGTYENSAFTSAKTTLLAATTTINAGIGGATFSGTVDGARSLTVNTAGTTIFSSALGGTTALLSLTTDAAGDTALNGGLVNTTGTQLYGDAVTLGALATEFNGTGITFSQTLDGASATTVNASGLTIFGGVVGGTTALTSLTTDAAGTLAINGGAITTSGFQTYNDAVSLLLDTQLASTGSGDINLLSTVNTASTATIFRTLIINTAGVTSFGDGGADNIGATRALAGLITDADGRTVFNILGGAQSVLTTGAQTYGDAVRLAENTVLSSTGGNISFNSTLDSVAAGSEHSLVVRSSGVTTFGDAVGSIFRLTSLTTDAPGSTAIDGGSIFTIGTQLYQDALTLLRDSTLTSSGAGNISFSSTVNTDAAAASNRDLTVNTAGTTLFASDVGSLRALGRLVTNAPGNTSLGRSVLTSQTQTYGDAVILAGNVVVTSDGGGSSGTIRFNSTVDSDAGGAKSLTVNTAGATIFSGIIGGSSRLNILTTDAPGTSSSVGASTAGSVTFFDNTTLAGRYQSSSFLARGTATLAGITRVSTNGGGVQFHKTLNGPYALTVNAPNETIFDGAVGGLVPLKSLTTDAAGQTDINGGLVVTSGAQTFGDDVQITKNLTLRSTRGKDIFFGGVLIGNYDVNVNTSGTTTFSSYVGLGDYASVGIDFALKSLTTDAGGRTFFKSGFAGSKATVETTGDQTYNDAVVLSKNSKFVSTGRGEIAFNRGVDSAGASVSLAINTAGNTILAGEIGRTRPLLSITTDAAGSTEFSDATISTTGEQLYQDVVDLSKDNVLTGETITFEKEIGGNSLVVSTTGGALTFAEVVKVKNLAAFASGGDLFIPNATATRTLSLASAQFIHLNGDTYTAGDAVLFNSTNPVNPQSPFSTIIAENGDLTIEAGNDFSMALHQRFFVTNGSLSITAGTATLGDTAAFASLTVEADSIVLRGRDKLEARDMREGDDDLGLSFVARAITFDGPLSYSDDTEQKVANFAVGSGQPLVRKIEGVTLFEDENIADQLDNQVFTVSAPIFQPVAGGISQAEVAETIAGALARKRDDKVAEDDSISDEDVRKLGEIGVFSRVFDQLQDFSLEKQFLYYQRDAFQNPKIPANYKVVTRRLQRELVTEVLEQSSKVNEMLKQCEPVIDKLQAEFKTTAAYTSEQAFLPYLETQLGTAEGKIVKDTLGEMKILFTKLPLLNLTAKEIDLAKNAISGRFPPNNLTGETDVALKRLLIENKQPEKAQPVEKKPAPPAPKVAAI